MALGTFVVLGGGMMALDGEEDLAGEDEDEEAVGELLPLPLPLPLPLLSLLETVVVVDDLCPRFTTFLIFCPPKVMLDFACQKKTI